MSGRAKRVLVYTATLLCAPMPLMPFERGTREFAVALLVCGAALVGGSLYVARGEWRARPRPLVGTKLLVSSVITLLVGLSLVAGSVAYLWPV